MSDPLPADVGGYQVVRRLGQGGMGQVFEAIDGASGQRVAVKVIHSEIAKSQSLMGRFEREVRAVAELSTPHIVRVLGAGTDAASGLPFMVMELLDGEDLAALVKRGGPVPVDLALRITAQACMALKAAHEQRVLHRDIKPANLFLSNESGGQRIVKLLDFGVAKIKPDPTQPAQQTAGLTRTGSMLGSPLYMSPEQARGYKDIDFRSDLWSLGVVLYQMLAGRTPHADTDELGELLIVICTEAPEPLQEVAPWVPKEVAAIVHRALRLSPEERFPSAVEMLSAITSLLPGGAVGITEAMLKPVTEEEKGRVAPKLTEGIVDAPPRRRGAVSSGASSNASSGGGAPAPISTLSSGAVSTGAQATSKASESPPALPVLPRSRAPLVIAGVVCAALLGGFALYQTTRTSAQPNPLPPAPTEPARPAETSKPRTSNLVVIPKTASVTVDGVPMTPVEGLVEIEGLLGSVHKVRVSAGSVEKEVRVVVTESGLMPPMVDVAEATGTTTATTAAAKPGPSGTKPGALPSGPRTSGPIVAPPLRTDR